MNYFLEDGDIDEALNAAYALGDDPIQTKIQEYIVPESFKNGSSAQRKAWLTKEY